MKPTLTTKKNQPLNAVQKRMVRVAAQEATRQMREQLNQMERKMDMLIEWKLKELNQEQKR